MGRHRHEAKQSPRVNSRLADRRLPSVTMPPWAVSPSSAGMHPASGFSAGSQRSLSATEGEIRSPKNIEISIPTGDELKKQSRSGSGGWQLLSCILLSLAVHGGLFSYVLMRFDASIGTGGASLEAINVEIVSASALESIEVNPPVDAKAAGQNVSMRPGSEAPVDQAEMQHQSENSKVLPSATEEAVLKSDRQDDPDPELRTADNVSSRENAVIADHETHADPERSLQKEIETNEGQAKIRQNAQDALTVGQAASRAAEASAAASAAALATEGQIARYAMLVRAALGAARPAHSGRRGRAIVRFLVDEAGSVTSARVTTSSGYVELDEAALSSVRKSSFPAPPPGLSEGQRQFLVPFDFK